MDNTHYTRMMMVPEQEYNTLKQSHTSQKSPLLHQHALDDLQKVNLPPDQFMKVYSSLIDRQKEHSFPEQSPEPEPPKTEWVMNSLQYMPQSNKTRATQLLHFLINKQPDIQWNERGEIKGLQFATIPGSNIIDLVNYVTNPRKQTIKSTGVSEFLHMLRALNVPHSLLSQQGQAELRRAIHSPSVVATSDSKPHTRNKKTYEDKPIDSWFTIP